MAHSHLDHHRAGSGEPLVLIHGIGHTWRGWKPMLPLLEQSFDVLAVDLPGHGRSQPFPPGLESTIDALADSVEQEMDAAGFGTAHIAGNSLGGWITLELARRGRAATATAISPAGLALPREQALGLNILRAVRWIARSAPATEEQLRNPVARTLLAGPHLGKPWKADPADLVEQGEMFANAPGFDATLPYLEGQQPRGLNEIECPVLLVWGTKDVVLFPRQGRRFERLIPDAELRYVKGLGHVPMSDDPEYLSEAIASFAARRAATPRREQPAAAPV
ncbi:MAG TPA: alpha/beta hydrolase [Thermoleophilaceae bacterium]